MLFIRMQGWRGGMEKGVSNNRCGWKSCPPPQDPPTLHGRMQEQPWHGALPGSMSGTNTGQRPRAGPVSQGPALELR